MSALSNSVQSVQPVPSGAENALGVAQIKHIRTGTARAEHLRWSCPPANPDHWQRCPTCSAPMRSDMRACTSAHRHFFEADGPILYASRTGTRRNLAAMADASMRLLVTPNQTYASMPPWAYGLDNGAWTAHTQGTPFDDDAYRVALSRFARRADWTVLPDIVCGGYESLALSLAWMDEVLPFAVNGPALVPVQDGMTLEEVARQVPLSPIVGIFVGGSTEWKEATMGDWARLAREYGAWCHVGRVNTQRRLKMVVDARAHSCDGTTATRFSVKAAPLAAARDRYAKSQRDQVVMFGDAA